MSAIQVHVAQGDRSAHAGALYAHRRGRTQSASFAYEPAYLRRPDAWAIDPALPLKTGAYQTATGQALFGALTDCAPDRWGQTLLTRREAHLARQEGRAARTLSDLDFLLEARDDLRQGALRFSDSPDPDGPFLATGDHGVPALTDLPALLDLADKATADAADLSDLQRLVHVGSSLGGARPKAHVRASDGSLAIAKFPSANQDTWNVMAWEKVALDLARAGGLRVPDSQLLHLNGRSVLVVKRFDRTPDSGRIGYVSAMTMLEATDRDQRSYLEIAGVIEERSDQPTLDLRELWRRAALSVLLSNTDDHLRNHGFLHRRADIWHLSPAFDLNPTPEAGAPVLSTSIDGTDEPATLEALLHVAGLFRLDDVRARTDLRQLAAAVATWPEVARRHGLSSAEISGMRAAFDLVRSATRV